jgi:aryl-alcohol dehydrogenase-like predicted oxidoreductase
LGRTGERVSIVGLGGYHLGIPTEEESVRIVRTALDHGMNFLDNCWDYNDGASEERMGKALRGGYRERAFLMTKLDGRTARAAAEQLEQSLRRLATETIDLVQIHEVIREDDPERCFAEGGAIEALVAARQAGKLRYLGFTGHKDPAIHLRMLERARQQGFRFDTVQMPLNVLDAHYRSFEREVLPVALADGVAVLGMKPMAAGWCCRAAPPAPRSAWATR